MTIAHETILEVSIKKLIDNYNFFKKNISTKTKIIAVIKAYGYGHGDVQIAKTLESLKVYAFWVADFEEGVRLRKNGITIPIIIANPGRKSEKYILANKLDIVIHNYELLEIYGNLNKNINIHIKFNSGMNRYGFNFSDLNQIINTLKRYPKLNIISLCSHLASSNDPEKDLFTNNQFNLFEKICCLFCKEIGYSVDRHILNSYGTLRFPEKQYEMIRLGIGLFGGVNHPSLKQIATFKTVITSIRDLKKGDAVGYNNSFIAKENMTIGIIPLGYADGLNRKLGDENGFVLVNGINCKIIGKISMDSCMIKLNDSNILVGEEVVVFGEEHKVHSIAEKLDTIPYEIYSTLNRRIKRIYSF